MHKLPYIITGAAILGLVCLAFAFLALNTGRLRTIFPITTASSVNSNTNQFIYDDPLITYVPAGDRSANQKTKVFVSSQDPLLGTDRAKVYVVFYGSLLDTTMQQYLAAAAELQASDEDNQVALVWKDNAITDEEQQAAMVGHCADRVDQFWEFAAALANNSLDVQQVATDAGVNATELADCLEHGGTSAQAAQSTALAGPLGATSEHTVFVNDQLFTEPMSIDELKQVIDETLASF